MSKTAPAPRKAPARGNQPSATSLRTKPKAAHVVHPPRKTAAASFQPLLRLAKRYDQVEHPDFHQRVHLKLSLADRIAIVIRDGGWSQQEILSQLHNSSGNGLIAGYARHLATIGDSKMIDTLVGLTARVTWLHTLRLVLDAIERLRPCPRCHPNLINRLRQTISPSLLERHDPGIINALHCIELILAHPCGECRYPMDHVPLGPRE